MRVDGTFAWWNVIACFTKTANVLSSLCRILSGAESEDNLDAIRTKACNMLATVIEGCSDMFFHLNFLEVKYY